MKGRIKSLLLLLMTVVLVGTSAGIEVIAKETVEASPKAAVATSKPAVGWKKIGKYTYYFNSKGKKEVNKIVGSTKTGYYYVDKQGKRVTTKEVRQAVSFVRKYTKPSWSKSKKLKVCYDKLWKKYPYKRSYDGCSAKKMPKFARDMFTKKKGNCYRYASAFAYIARVIGYDSRVAVGKIGHRGGGTTPHGWTEIKSGRKWKKCDANMQRSYPKINCYMQTKYRFSRQSCSKRYTLKVSNGKVSWK